MTRDRPRRRVGCGEATRQVRFVEVTVNGPKTWSLAAALHPEIGAAYDAAQRQSAQEIIAWVAEHATTRVGPRDRQVQVPIEQVEAAVVRHFTSRAGDPHRHLHLQINARVLVSTGSTTGWVWRGLHTVGVRDSLEAINGIGHAAVMTNPDFRRSLAAHGLTLEAESGEVVELARYTGTFSARAKQIESNIDTYEAEWRAGHPGEEPGPALRQAWDRRAWADARPDKVVPTSGEELREHWVERNGHESGFQGLDKLDRGHGVPELKAGALDRNGLVDLALVRLGARRSAWNSADARGEVERLIAATGGAIDSVVRRELAEDLTARVVPASRPLLGRTDVPEHVRSFTSSDVVAVEHEIVDRIAARADAWAIRIVEGAAGAGKTARLAATRERALAVGHRMVVVTPTRKAAQVAEGALGAASYSAAWLLHSTASAGTRTAGGAASIPRRSRRPDAGGRPAGGRRGRHGRPGTARALLRLADELHTPVMLVGDRHQLPAVGRGGVLDLAIRYAPDRVTQLDGIRRFADPTYAQLSLRMRTG